jgi:hypothetical protein
VYCLVEKKSDRSRGEEVVQQGESFEMQLLSLLSRSLLKDTGTVLIRLFN